MESKSCCRAPKFISYTRFDLNLPESLPKRSDGHEAYQRDTPLTVMGYLQATLIGKEYRRNGVKIDQVYSSPALRSIETAQAFLEGYGRYRSQMFHVL